MYKPLCVFRVYFKPDRRPHHRAEFELVAIAATDEADAMAMLDEGQTLLCWRLIGWPAPHEPRARLIDKIYTHKLVREDVERVVPNDIACMFRLRNAAPAQTAEAAE